MRVLLAGCLLCACGVVKTETATVNITPTAPMTDDDLIATVAGSTDFMLQWSKNGAASDVTGDTIAHALTTRGDVWHVDVLSGSEILASDERTIVNTPPPKPVVHLVPEQPAPGFPITCAVDASPPDADGDVVTIALSWTKNGAPYGSASMTAIAGDTVPAADVANSDSFACTVVANDTFETATGMTQATASCDTGGAMSFAVNGTFETGTIQLFTVPTNLCAATIEAAGAHGGIGNTNGAKMIGTFPLLAGTQLQILVGQQPTAIPVGGTQILAGGGGTFVVGPGNVPLVIAGGGGSNFTGTIADAELQGRIVTSGGTGTGGTRVDNGAGGTSANATSGGGGGFLGDGANGGGSAFIHGGAGNVGDAEYHAGFGGGGNRTGSYGEGGGGGYSGGSCTNGAAAWVGCGGGGSINHGAMQVNTPGANIGDGYVTITW